MTRTTLRTRITAVAAVGLVSFGAAACGSSTSKTTSPVTTTPSGSAAPAASAASAKIRIVNFMFEPMSVTIKVGGTVTWTQVDPTGHSVESDDGAWKTSNVLKPGQTFVHKFTKAGTYNYICGVHNYMKGTVKVVG